jgi:hypothetical protein
MNIPPKPITQQLLMRMDERNILGNLGSSLIHGRSSSTFSIPML